jgi:hypothetical protein
MDIAAHIIDLYFLKGDSFLFRAGLGTEFLALAFLMAFGIGRESMRTFYFGGGSGLSFFFALGRR